MRNYTACMAECDNSPDADIYCQFVDIITPISYGGTYISKISKSIQYQTIQGSIACADGYEQSKPVKAGENEAIWARVWFEVCR